MNRIDELIARLGGCQLSTHDTLRASYQLTKSVIEQGVPGELVECGVFAGAQSAMMAFAMQDAATPMWRHIHMFDTFTGIPAGGVEDTNWTHPAGTSACSQSRVHANMVGWGFDPQRFTLWPGLVEDTLPTFVLGMATGKRKIAVLRIDVDLYEPTKVVMEQLVPLVSPGGWIICDDFGLPGARKAILATMGDQPIYWRKL